MPPPAVVHWHLVDAPLEAGGDDDEVSEGDPESSSSSSLEAGGDDDEVAEADADLYFWRPEEVSEDDLHFSPVDRPPTPDDDPPPEDDPPPPAAPEPPPAKCDASAVAEPVPPHTLPLDATPVGSAPQSDLQPLDATQVALLEAPAGGPIRPMQAAAPLPS